MKKDIHPNYGKIKVLIGDDVIYTKSTIGAKEGEAKEVLMDVDFRKCPAWNKSSVNIVNQSSKKISDFNSKFANMSFGLKKAK